LRKAGLTDTAIRRFDALVGKRIRHSDWPASPLELQVSSSHKAWTSRPRINGRQEKITYGSYPSLSLARARELANAAHAAAKAGADVNTVRAIARGADPAKLEAKPVDLVAQVVDDFTERHLHQRKRSATHVSTTCNLARAFYGRPLSVARNESQCGVLGRLNSLLRGWSAYFTYGTRSIVLTVKDALNGGGAPC
jgi:hypothetical protein